LLLSSLDGGKLVLAGLQPRDELLLVPEVRVPSSLVRRLVQAAGNALGSWGEGLGSASRWL